MPLTEAGETMHLDFSSLILPYFRQVENTVEYLEMRLEHVHKLAIYIKKDRINHSLLEDLQGGYIRAYHRGQWGFSLFDRLEEKRIKDAVRSALKNTASQTAEKPSSSRQNSATGGPLVIKPAADMIGLSRYTQRLDKLLQASEKILAEPDIVSNQIDYMEISKKRFFIKTGTPPISDERCFVSFNTVPMLKKEGKIMNIYKNFAAGEKDFLNSFPVNKHFIRSVLGSFCDCSRQLKKLPPGDYAVILDPETSGFLIHEVLGHLLEADLLYNHPSYLMEKIKLGNRLAGKDLTIIDDPNLPKQGGSYQFDDEGNAGEKVHLVTEGTITGLLHSMETAKKLKQKNNGHARSIEYHLPPFIRMSNTYINPQDNTFKDILADTPQGVYLKNCMFAKSDMEHFQLFPKEAYYLEKGKIAGSIAPPVAFGNIFEVLRRITAVGNDLQFFNVACTKGFSDAWIPVSVGGVHLKVEKMTLGASIL